MPTSPTKAVLPEVPKLNPGVRFFTPTPVRDAAPPHAPPVLSLAFPHVPEVVAQGKTTIRISLPKPAALSPILSAGPTPTSGRAQIKGVAASSVSSYGPRRMTEEAGHSSGEAPRSPWDQIISDYLGGSDGRSGRRMTTLD